MTTRKKIQVLVIDDSAAVRKVLSDWIQEQPDMEVCVASDPYTAVEMMRQQKPDVITLDIEMPRMDGLTFLRKLMSQHPVPVIIVSSLSKNGSDVSIRALMYGAVDIFLKDDIRVVSYDRHRYESLVQKIRTASTASVKRYSGEITKTTSKELSGIATTEKTVVLGASTGGTQAIKEIVTNLPLDSPGMVIVQHMPKAFTRDFARHLNDASGLTINEAKDGDSIVPGKVLIAPGDLHVKVVRSGVRVHVRTCDGPRVNLHKPSVDVLFESAANQLGVNAIGVLLTGMGKDGAEGLLAMKLKGATTIAQDEETSVVYGMPREAVRINAAQKVLPLGEIPKCIIDSAY